MQLKLLQLQSEIHLSDIARPRTGQLEGQKIYIYLYIIYFIYFF